MTLEKGAMIFHMLRWEVGDKAFLATSKALSASTPTSPCAPATLKSRRRAEPTAAHALLRAVDRRHRRAQFTDKYAVYRLGNNKGFRTIGQFSRISTSSACPSICASRPTAKPKPRRSTSSAPIRNTSSTPSAAPAASPSIPTTGCSSPPRPAGAHRHPQRPAARRPGRPPGASPSTRRPSTPIRKARSPTTASAKLLFTQRNYQASVNAYRDALRGDGEPRWTEVWSHIALGKIFDITGQRDRAVNEYRLAVQTNDNTQGAVNEARQWLQKPYKRPDTGIGRDAPRSGIARLAHH
jgi:tetratricopeptide (TPR) repeat protein